MAVVADHWPALQRKGLELFESKTNTSRQTLHTAIGQLSVLAEANTRETLVVPAEPIDRDMARWLRHNGIDVITYTLVGARVDLRRSDQR